MSQNNNNPRRDFFKSLIKKSGETVSDVIQYKMEKNFPRVVLRPPGAIEEYQFLLNCSRCGDCATECPKEAIHLMTNASGAYKNTPFIDPKHQACVFCEDFPCIEACEPKSLVKSTNKNSMKIGIATTNLSDCLVYQNQHCDYCFGSCPPGVNAIQKSKEGWPEIDKDLCVGCGKCAYICVSQTGDAISIEPI